jgi:SHS2 domain-containing protein
MEERFQFLEHTADIKFQAFGKNLEGVFSNCAYAMINAICKEKIKGDKIVSFKTKGNDLGNLLSNFLEEFLFLFDSKKIVLSKIKKIKINSKKLELECSFVGDFTESYVFHTYIKAITYNEMFIKKQKNNFVAQVVLDV